MKSEDTNFDLDFDLSPKELVASLMKTVEFYRGKGRTLTEIHAALSKRADFSISFGCFKNQYYSQRKNSNHSSSEVADKGQQERVPGCVVTSEQRESRSDDFVNEAKSENRNTKRARSLTLDERLAEHQRIAAIEFFK